MKGACVLVVAGWISVALGAAADASAERQVTSTPKNHNLDNNDNFSPDGRFLCYDTRETVGPGIDNAQTIERVEIATGEETVLYAPRPTLTGERAAPGVGAVSFSPVADEVVFIHGPFVHETHHRGYYAKPNRLGAVVAADGSGRLAWLDVRDVATDRDTLPGAHRGGTHRHEYSFDGRRIGFTYDDSLMTQYGRTIGMLLPHEDAPSPATHYFALLVAVAPAGEAKPGDLEIASGDSWIGREGLMRGFIGKVREDDGSYMESLFVVDVPADIDITTADAGSATRYPAPPRGLRIRRLTHTPASGTVRGTLAGDRIAYYAAAEDGSRQVFIVPADGSDRDPDPEKRPVQATHIPGGVSGGVRWHPSGHSILCMADSGIVVTTVKPGPGFGKSVFLTPRGRGPERIDPVLSPDGTTIAYTRATPTQDASGETVKTYSGEDFQQIFVVAFPDLDGDGVAG